VHNAEGYGSATSNFLSEIPEQGDSIHGSTGSPRTESTLTVHPESIEGFGQKWAIIKP